MTSDISDSLEVREPDRPFTVVYAIMAIDHEQDIFEGVWRLQADAEKALAELGDGYYILETPLR